MISQTALASVPPAQLSIPLTLLIFDLPRYVSLSLNDELLMLSLLLEELFLIGGFPGCLSIDMVLRSLMLVLLSPIVFTYDPIDPLSFFSNPAISVLLSLRIVKFNVPLPLSSFFFRYFLPGTPLLVKRLLFLIEHVGNFLIIVVPFHLYLILLTLLESVHPIDVGQGSLPFLLLLHILVVHVFSLLCSDHLELLLLLDLLMPYLSLLLLEELTTLPLLLCNLRLLLSFRLLLYRGLLGPSLLLAPHPFISFILLLLNSLCIHVLETFSLGLGACLSCVSSQTLGLSGLGLLSFPLECPLNFVLHCGLSLIQLLLFKPIKLLQIAILSIKLLVVDLLLKTLRSNLL